MAKLTEQQYQEALQYIQQRLLERQNKAYGYIITTEVEKLQEVAPYTGYIENTGVKKKVRKPVDENNGWEELWNNYPSSANFTYKGMKFTSSRVLRSNRQVCEMLYIRGMKENNVTGEQILSALKKQLHLLKEESYESGQNRLQYMPGIEPWLRQAMYLAFLDVESAEDQEDNSANYA